MIEEKYRSPRASERELIEQLTRLSFAGIDGVREQLASCEVRVIDSEGSLELAVKNRAKAAVRNRVPVELHGSDTDGAGVHVLLHVVDGICKEIEIYKDTPSPISALPKNWEVFVPQ